MGKNLIKERKKKYRITVAPNAFLFCKYGPEYVGINLKRRNVWRQKTL